MPGIRKNRWPLKYMKSEGVQMKKIRVLVGAVYGALAGCAQDECTDAVKGNRQLHMNFRRVRHSFWKLLGWIKIEIVSFCAPETVITVTAGFIN